LTSVFTGKEPTVMERRRAWLVWSLWGVVVALAGVIALALVADVL